MIITVVDDLVPGPVSRVIIRDPQPTADDSSPWPTELGLHGTNYVVGSTAWLDLSPVGVSTIVRPRALSQLVLCRY